MRRLLTLLLLGLMSVPAHAHRPDQSYVYIDVYDDALEGRVEITFRDLNLALGLALPEAGGVALEQIEDDLPAIRDYVLKHVALGINGGPMSLPLTGFSTHEIPLGQYLVLEFAFEDLPAPPESVELRYSAVMDQVKSHRGFLIVEDNWKTGTFGNEGQISLSFEPGSGIKTLDLSDSSAWRGFMAMTGMGVHHIWIGLDHILFLLALLIPSVVRREGGRWMPVESFRAALIYVLKIVTLFTIAHTITLSLAALGKISLSPRLVESLIALSIAVAALDILVPVFHRKIWWVVFGFGLFHGFGFASILGDVGIPPKYMVHSLLGFNLGVELGQVVIVCALFPLLYGLRNTRAYTGLLMKAGAVALITIALYWFVERAFEIDLPAGAILNWIMGVEK